MEPCKIKDEFTYDNLNHIYKYNGKIIPSVTEIIPKQDFHCSETVLENAKREGLDNHGSIKMYHDLKGDTMGNPLLIAFDYWIKENRSMLGDLVCYENPMYSKIGFAGRPDMIFSKAIVDLKRSRGNSKMNALQLGAYNILAKENYKLNLKKWIMIYYDGTMIRQYNVFNALAEPVFRSLVQRYYIDQELKKYLEA